MALKLVTAPAVEPITTAQAKTHAVIETADDDDYVDTLILAAREYVEQITNRAIITQTWDYFLDSFADEIEIPKGQLGSITSVKYLDTDGVQQTAASSVYAVDTNSDPGRVYLDYQQTWPSIRGDRHSVGIRFIAGYGLAVAVPQPIIAAMQVLITHWYEERAAGAPIAIKEVPMLFNDLIGNYRIY